MALNDERFNELYLFCCGIINELGDLLKNSFSDTEIASCIAEVMKPGVLEADFKAYIAPIILKMLQERTPVEVCGVNRRLAIFYSLASRPTKIILNDGVKTSTVLISFVNYMYTENFDEFEMNVDGPPLLRKLRFYAMAYYPVSPAYRLVEGLGGEKVTALVAELLSIYRAFISYSIDAPLRKWCGENEIGLFIDRALDPNEDFLLLLSDVDKAIWPFRQVTKDKYDSIAKHLAILRSTALGGKAVPVKIYGDRTVNGTTTTIPCGPSLGGKFSSVVNRDPRFVTLTFYAKEEHQLPSITSSLGASTDAYDDLLSEQLYNALRVEARATYPMKIREAVVSSLEQDLNAIGKILFLRGRALEEIGESLFNLMRPHAVSRNGLANALLGMVGKSLERSLLRLKLNAEGGQDAVKLTLNGGEVNLATDTQKQYPGYQYTPKEALKVNEALLVYLSEAFPNLRKKVASFFKGMIHLAPNTWKGNLAKWRQYDAAYEKTRLITGDASFEVLILKNRKDYYARCYLGNVFGIIGLTVLTVGAVVTLPVLGMIAGGGAVATTLGMKAAIGKGIIAAATTSAMPTEAMATGGVVAGVALAATAGGVMLARREDAQSSTSEQDEVVADHLQTIKRLLQDIEPMLSEAEMDKRLIDFTPSQLQQFVQILEHELAITKGGMSGVDEAFPVDNVSSLDGPVGVDEAFPVEEKLKPWQQPGNERRLLFHTVTENAPKHLQAALRMSPASM